MSHVYFEVDQGLARVTLNRPQAINALTLEMCQTMLDAFTAWVDEEAVESIELCGAGDRGFCAGADVRILREQLLSGQGGLVEAFFAVEYELNALLANYPKPITAYQHGVTMGGGVGLSAHVPHRIVDETTKLAMPETTIGLFPDVGAGFELSRAPGEIGAYLAMTGEAIDGASAIYAGFADEGVDGPSELEADRDWIDECFVGSDAVLIHERLLAHPNPKARAAGELLGTKSPWSVCVSLELVRRAAKLDSVAQVLEQDLVVARNYVRDSDFIEGVRAQLVDKDRAPKWRHAKLADVPAELVASMFEA